MRPALSFFVVGLPKGQPRVKACRFGNISRVYTPGSANEWKMFVRDAANKAWDKVPWEGPLCVNVTFYFPRPKAHYGKLGLKQNAPKYHTSRCDLDNGLKAIFDALTDFGLWRDDAIIAATNSKKLYATTAGLTGAQIDIMEAQ